MTKLIISDNVIIKDEDGNVLDADVNGDLTDMTNVGMFCARDEQVIAGSKLFRIDEHGNPEPKENIIMEFYVMKDAALTGRSEVELGDLPSPLRDICDKYVNMGNPSRK